MANSKKSITKRGFTLVELLVAISIIAVLSSTGTTVYTNARNQALKAKRMADIDSIKKAYEKNFSPELNNGQGGYKMLQPADFTNNKIPVPDKVSSNPIENSYIVFGPPPAGNAAAQPIVEKNSSFVACSNVSEGSRCAAPSSTCYCAISNQGEKVSIPSPNSSCDAFDLLKNGLVAHWKMDEGINQTVADLVSPASNNGTLGSSSSAASDDPVWVTDESQCKLGKCLGFNGLSGYKFVRVAGGGNIPVNNTPFTISLWFRANNFVSPDAPELFQIPTTAGWIAIRVAYNDEVEFQVRGNSATVEINSPNSYVRADQWYHVTAIYNPTGATQMYINGNLMTDSSTASAGTLTKTGDITIGKAFNGWNWNGKIDDVRFYSRALNAGEVALLYSSGSGCI